MNIKEDCTYLVIGKESHALIANRITNITIGLNICRVLVLDAMWHSSTRLQYFSLGIVYLLSFSPMPAAYQCGPSSSSSLSSLSSSYSLSSFILWWSKIKLLTVSMVFCLPNIAAAFLKLTIGENEIINWCYFISLVCLTELFESTIKCESKNMCNIYNHVWVTNHWWSNAKSANLWLH